jgi:IS605 OrfB family transposase
MFLTCKFKLHNLSARKRGVLIHALEQYTLGYNDLLKWARDNEEYLNLNGKYIPKGKEDGKHTGMSIRALLPRVDCEVHSSMKDSLAADVAANLASYFELGDNAGFPTARTHLDSEIEQAAEYFALVGASEEDYDTARNYFLRRSHADYMPVSFCRADGATKSRNFSLLVNTEKRQLLAALWLLPARHSLCRPLNAKRGNLIRVDTREEFVSNSTTAILVPLEIGSNGWQQYKFLDPAYEGQIQVKTAKLLYQSGEFYLAVAFKFEEPETYKPQAYLGVDRGVFFSMAYALVDSKGRIMKMESNPDGFRDHTIQANKRVQDKHKLGRQVTFRDYKRKEGEAILHRLVNGILDTAEEHKAMIVFEQLNIRIKGKFYKSAWAKMHKFTEYKAKLRGIPIWRGGVWAANSSTICIYCGGLNQNRKRDRSPFTCPSCGLVYHSDAGAGVNIARRALYKKKVWEKKGGYMAFHRSFANLGTFKAK